MDAESKRDFMNGLAALAILFCCAVIVELSVNPGEPSIEHSPQQIGTPFPWPSIEQDELVPAPGIVGDPRSGKWPAVRAAYFAEHPRCEFKGCACKGPFNVHHVEPFHVDPAKELDPTNFITLCEAANRCHLEIGHQGSWRNVVPTVRADAANALNHLH